MAKDDLKSDISREDAYRDYDQRNITDGWPYSDTPAAPGDAVQNHAYGETEANFDRERNGGFRVDGVEADGFQPSLDTPDQPASAHRDAADQLEADVTSALEGLDEHLLATLDVHVDGHEVTLRGAVDTAEERRLIERQALGVPGVRAVVNHITTLGVDSHIPRDAD